MLEFSLPPPSDEILFEAVLEPTKSALKKLETKRGVGEGEITTFLGKVNKVVTATTVRLPKKKAVKEFQIILPKNEL